MSLAEQFAPAWQLLDKQKKIAVLYDGDADGTSAAALFRHSMRAECLMSTPGERKFPPDFIANIAKEVDTVVCLDIDPFNYGSYDVFEQAFGEKEFNLIIIDHHPPQGQPGDHVIRVNPHSAGHPLGSRYCTAKLVYDLCGAYTDLSKYDFLAALGVIGDHAANDFSEFLFALKEKYHIDGEIKDYTDWFRSPFAHLLSHINSAAAVGTEGLSKITELLFSLETFEQALESKNPYQEVQRSVENFVRSYKESMHVDEERKIIWLQLDTPYKIGSWVSSIISNDQPEYMYLVSVPMGETMLVHARCQSQHINCGEVLRICLSKIDSAQGGGHVPAAGGRLPLKDFEQFVALVNEYIDDE